MIVKFKNVGRNSVSWDAECSEKEWTYEWFCSQVRSHARVMSRDIEIDYTNGENGKPEKGVIFAGFHDIGEFTVEGA